MTSPADTVPTPADPAHIRRPWCVRLAVALVILGAVLNLLYLFNACPLDLGEDESHYWEWSRHLDYGYYSKPPGIAWTIRGAVEFARACGVVGERDGGAALMPFIRIPAIVCSVVSGLTLIALARRIFRDDRAALATVLLSAAAPVFVVGSLLITIDAPMYMCWTLALYFLWRYLEPTPSGQCEMRNAQCETKSAPAISHCAFRLSHFLYLAAFFVALGMLFKPLLIAFPLSAAVAAIFSPHIRGRFKTLHTIPAVLLVLSSQIPVILWNAAHNWVTFRHMGGQAGLAGGGAAKSLAAKLAAPFAREGAYLGGQAGILGGALAIFLVLAVIHAIKARRAAGPNTAPHARYTFLLSFFLPLWLFYAVLALWTNTEPNWPAASYAAGFTLLAGVVAMHYNHPDAATRRPWRFWLTGTVVLGILFAAAALNLHRFYPLIADEKTPLEKMPHPRKWDPSATKLRGFADRAAVVEKARAAFAAETATTAGPGDIRIVALRYDTASSLAFYLPGQPFVGCIMSRVGGRANQYDMWPDFEPPASADPARPTHVLLVGVVSPAVLNTVIAPAFDRIDRTPDGKPNYQRALIPYHGVIIREVITLKCYGFKGWPRRAGVTPY